MYALVSATDIMPSHHWNSQIANPNYPAYLQGRAYSGQFGRPASAHLATQVLDPAHVLDLTQFPWGGPPICTASGTVVVGNHRAILLQRAALSSVDRDVKAYDAYHSELLDWAAERGLDRSSISATDRPVLVRVLDERSWAADWHVTDDASRDAFLCKLNLLSDRPPTKAYDVASGGIALAASLLYAHGAVRRDALDALSRLFAGSSLHKGLSGARAYDLVRLLTQWGALSPAEHAGMIDPDAEKLSATGCERMQWMVRSLVLDNRVLLLSTRPWVLKQLDHCWGELLAAVAGPSCAVVRSRLAHALVRAGSAHINGVSPGESAKVLDERHDESEPHRPDILHRPGIRCESAEKDLAMCILRLRKGGLACVMRQWIEALALAPDGDGAVFFDGFGPAVDRDGSRERAVLAAALVGVAHRHLRKLPSTANPEEYLSPTEWLALEPLLAQPTDRLSPAECGGRPAVSNLALAAGLVYAFTIGATPETLLATWPQLPRTWHTNKLVGGRSTLKRRLARAKKLPGGCGALFDALTRVAAARHDAIRQAL